MTATSSVAETTLVAAADSAVATADTVAAGIHALSLHDRVDLGSYLIWLWVVIAALVYVLVLRIREADASHRMGFDQAGAPDRTGHGQP